MAEEGVTTSAQVEAAIRAGLDPIEKIVIVDDSAGCGSKFVIYISSPKFEGMKTLERHRTVNGLLTTSGLMAKIHAITIKAWTAAEWEKNAAQVPAQ